MTNFILGALSGAALVAALISPALAEDPAPAATGLATLYKFPGGSHGRHPRGGVVMDKDGNVYGTTLYDGDCSTCGIVYKLKAPNWQQTILHKFKLGKEGIGPTAPLVIDGNTLYGTTSAGGDPSCGCGTIFKINTDGSGYKILHVFTPSKQGSTPIGGLLIVGSTMYGTTSAGGKKGAGIIYKISKSGGGFKILYEFPSNFNGGPQGELLLGKDGMIYGTQYGGGKYNQGTIFRITKAGSFKLLYNFKGVNQPGGSHDGAQPEGRLVQLGNQRIYGTTTFGGSPSGYGTMWSIKPDGSDYRQHFIFGGIDIANLPHSGLVKGNGTSFYGTGAGGGHFQSGAIYKMTPPASGDTWHHTLMYSFKGLNPNGDIPYAVLFSDSNTLYGVNIQGGKLSGCGNGCGTVFSFKP